MEELDNDTAEEKDIMAWTPMFALPNINVVEPIEVTHFGLLAATDARVADLRKKHENFETYLSHFSTEFQVESPPMRPSSSAWLWQRSLT